MQSVGLQPVKKWDYGRLGLNFQTGMLFEDQEKYVDPWNVSNSEKAGLENSKCAKNVNGANRSVLGLW